MNIYFSCSIKGGRQKAKDYEIIGKEIKKYGTILNENVLNPNLSANGDDMTKQDAYERSTNSIKQCDIVIAEVTTPSLGVGYEIALAESLEKRIICLYEKEANVSAMIIGNSNILAVPYEKLDELIIKIQELLEL